MIETEHSDLLHRQLDELLSEGSEAAAERETRTFEQSAGSFAERLILFGAGGFGRRALAGLRRYGIAPLAFVDNNEALWNRKIDGLMVLPPSVAAEQFSDNAVFVVTIWRAGSNDKMSARQQQLRDLGCKFVLPFGPLFWRYPEGVLPHYGADLPHKVFEESDRVSQALDLWSDASSKQEYLSQVRWRLFMDWDCLRDPVAHPIYFPSDHCALTNDEVFVDCGAFDGDTIRLFLEQCHSRFRHIFGYEPDPSNFARLQDMISALPEATARGITTKCAAVGRRSGRIKFTAQGAPSSHVGGGAGDSEVEVVALDSALGDVVPTYLKMDIEGAEPDALVGAAELIQKHAPVLAVSVYHRQDHLWNIPLQIQALNPDYRFLLRPHDLEMWDLVCYAIPRYRFNESQSGSGH